MNYEAWAVRSLGGGATDITVGEMPTMPIIPRVGIKAGGVRRERTELHIVEGVEQPELKALVGAGFAPPNGCHSAGRESGRRSHSHAPAGGKAPGSSPGPHALRLPGDG